MEGALVEKHVFLNLLVLDLLLRHVEGRSR